MSGSNGGNDPLRNKNMMRQKYLATARKGNLTPAKTWHEANPVPKKVWRGENNLKIKPEFIIRNNGITEIDGYNGAKKLLLLKE